MCTPQRTYSSLGTPANPTTCIFDCRARFLQKTAGTTDLSAVCNALNGNGGSTLADFYCCNSVLYSVLKTSAGQDPNTEWIIASCQSLGFSNIFDSRSPGPGTTCLTSTLYAPDETPCAVSSSEALRSSRKISSAASSSSSTSSVALGMFAADVKPADVAFIGNPTAPKMTTSQVKTLDIPGSSTSTSSPPSNTSLVLSSSSSSSSSPSPAQVSSSSSTSAPFFLPASNKSSPLTQAQSPGMPTFIRAVIAVCSILALLTLSLLFFLFRRYRYPFTSFSSSSSSPKPPLLSHARTLSSPPESPAYIAPRPPRPTAAPACGISPLVPPARLKDRQYITTPPRTMENSPVGQGTFGAHVMRDSFPQNPICAPTVSHLKPRAEKFCRLNAAASSSSSSSLPLPKSPRVSRAKRYSGNSAVSVSSSQYYNFTVHSDYPAPLSPAVISGIFVAPQRPPRLGTELVIPDLVKPAPKVHPLSPGKPTVPRGTPPAVPPMHPGRALSAKGSRRHEEGTPGSGHNGHFGVSTEGERVML